MDKSIAEEREIGPTSIHHVLRKERARVRFNSSGEVSDETNRRSSVPIRDGTLESPAAPGPVNSRSNSDGNLSPNTPDLESTDGVDDLALRDMGIPSGARNSSASIELLQTSRGKDNESEQNQKTVSALAAQERAQRVAHLVGSNSAPASQRSSFDGATENHSLFHPGDRYPVRFDDIPLVQLGRRPYDAPEDDDEQSAANFRRERDEFSSSEAHKLVRAYTKRMDSKTLYAGSGPSPNLLSGQTTPTAEQHEDDYVSRPNQYRGGVLSSLLKLYNDPFVRRSNEGTSAGSTSQTVTPGSSGTTTPKKKHTKWYKHPTHSTDTLSQLVEASRLLNAPGTHSVSSPTSNGRPSAHRSHSSKFMDATIGRMSRPRLEDEIRITIHKL